MARRLTRLVFGLLLCGTGIALMIDADLGLAPWDVLHQGIAEHTGIEIGTVAIFVGFVVLLAWIPLGERIGVGTVLKDNPTLTARLSDRLLKLAPRQPLRVVLDSRLRTPPTATVCAKQDRAKTLIVTTSRASRSRRRPFEQAGVEVVSLSAKNGRVSFPALLTMLGRRGITSVLIEGGSTINAAALHEKLVNHVVLYLAPILMGGQDAKAVIGDRSPNRLAQALPLRHVTVRRIGKDLVVEGDL